LTVAVGHPVVEGVPAQDLQPQAEVGLVGVGVGLAWGRLLVGSARQRDEPLGVEAAVVGGADPCLTPGAAAPCATTLMCQKRRV